eukprot:TRINITY_DN14363_c0_g4_i2.p1 TRINITY_DN14363_c0_g4~~TRINITY_DN14363_c0_g4_i2.p1  ORF type:complete len:614 (+),score=136.12 TRINITY_DN14363_c0_g4_i2:92-1933(+)
MGLSLEEVCKCCCGCLIRASYRATDSPKERALKVILLPTFLIGFVVLAVILLIEWASQGVGVRDLYTASLLLNLPVTATAVLVTLLTDVHITRLAEFLIIGMIAGLIMADWRNSAILAGRVWSMAVVMADLGFVVQARSWATNAIIISICLWIVIEAVESALHFGLYDWAFFADREKPALCDCAFPPCERGPAGAFSLAFFTLFVFFVDFYMTRGFASQMHQQLRMVESSVQVAANITVHLSNYETGRARDVVDGDSGAGLPFRLRDSLQQLITNLETYRPFLPQSCLPHPEEEGTEGSTEGDGEGCSPRTTQTSGSSAGMSRRGSPPSNMSPRTSAVSAESPRSRRRSVCSSPLAAEECEREMSGTSDSPAQQVFRAPSPGANQCAVRAAAVTLACANRRGFLEEITRHAAGSDCARDLSDWLGAAIPSFLHVVTDNKGVVDHISSDHFFASFAAARPCSSHRAAAVRSMFLLKSAWANVDGQRQRPQVEGSDQGIEQIQCERDLWSLPTSFAICSARSVVGDFGNDQMKKFMVVGSVYWRLLVTDRIAAAGDADIVCDGIVAEDVTSAYELRRMRPVVFRKIAPGKALPLWAVTHKLKASSQGPAGRGSTP